MSINRTLFESITESPETFVDWLLAEKKPTVVSAEGFELGIDTGISLTPAALLECDPDEDGVMEEQECFVTELTAEQYNELRQALLMGLNSEV